MTVEEINFKKPSENKAREILVEAIRRLDEGEMNPDFLIICYSQSDESLEDDDSFPPTTIGYRKTSGSTIEAIGLLKATSNLIYENSYGD